MEAKTALGCSASEEEYLLTYSMGKQPLKSFDRPLMWVSSSN